MCVGESCVKVKSKPVGLTVLHTFNSCPLGQTMPLIQPKNEATFSFDPYSFIMPTMVLEMDEVNINFTLFRRNDTS